MLLDKYSFSSDQYWREGEFTDDDGAHGDPKNLRALQAAAFMITSSESQSDIDLIYENWDKFCYFIEEYKKQNPNDPLINDAMAILDSIAPMRGHRHVPNEQLEGWRNSIRLLLAKNSFDPTNNLAEAVQLRRSMYMLQAAQRSNKTGVWKVGDFHISDLRGHNVGNKTTLTSELEFDQEFVPWRIDLNQFDVSSDFTELFKSDVTFPDFSDVQNVTFPDFF
jgi:hypothetical protein